MIHLHDILLFAFPLCTSALLLAALHWLPWNGGAKELDRITAYTVGTSVVVGVPVLTMVLAAALQLNRNELFWAAMLLTNMLVSGGTVKLCYWIDSTRTVTLDEVSHATTSGR